ncbi:MAG TPA: DUF2252 family protein [Steroidobacteraceae bacterium]
MNIIESTRRYERWLMQHLRLLPRDLQLKHRRMREEAFFFLRAGFYRWAQVWPRVCPALAAAPQVLGVGDLHVENFGTWRDEEGRLIWGINDFDEATKLPYANDLVRLCTSALLAIDESRLATSTRRACEAVLEGYSQALREEGTPVVLAERHRWLRDIAVGRLKEQRAYWDHLLRLKPLAGAVPAEVRRLLREALPEPDLTFRLVHRQAGLGSLGRQRFTALADWRGGTIAREAKPLTASAWTWAAGRPAQQLLYGRIIQRAVRVPDPFLAVHEKWVIRRLAPDCSRIELSRMGNVHDSCKLLWMMGWETGNVHLGTPAQCKLIRRDLAQRKGNWLSQAARSMRAATLADWRAWRAGARA